MKFTITLTVMLFSIMLSAQNNVGIGTATPNPQAILEVESTEKGILISRLTTTARTALGAALTGIEDGMLVYDKDLTNFFFWDGPNLQWVQVGTGTGDNWGSQAVQTTGTNISGDGTPANPLIVTESDADPNNEIELPTGGGNGQVLTTDGNGNYSWANDNPGTDNQGLSLSGNTLSISNGNSVTLVDNVVDGDADPNNEIELPAGGANGQVLTTDGSGNYSWENDNPGTDNQELSMSGDILSLSNGNTTIDLGPIRDHDWYEVGGTSQPDAIGDDVYTQGKVGIGTTTPLTKLQVVGGTDANYNDNSGYLLMGDPTNYNLVIDNNEIISRRNGAASILYINKDSMVTTSFGVADYPALKNKARVVIDNDPTQNELGSGLFFSGSSSVNNFADIIYQEGEALNFGMIDTTTGLLVGADLLVLDHNGNIGMGTVAPSELLELRDGGMQFNGQFGIGFAGATPYESSIIAGPDAAKIYFDTNTDLTPSTNNDFLFIEKVDPNGTTPDGGIAFSNRGSTGVRNVAMVVRGSGRVGIGVNSPTTLLQVNGTAGKTGGGSWTATSDRRTKKDITDFTPGLDVLTQINPVTFKYNGLYNTSDDGKDYVGIIAQEVQEVAPYMIGSHKVPKTLDAPIEEEILNYDGGTHLLYILVNSVKEQQQQINQLKLELAEERKRNAANSEALEALKGQ